MGRACLFQKRQPSSPLSTAMQEASLVLASLPIFPEKLEIQLSCEISLSLFFLFFHFGSLSTSLKTNYFTSQAKRYLRARCGLWAGGVRWLNLVQRLLYSDMGTERAFVAAGGLVQGCGARR